jgi:hypothetical protein
MSISAMKQAYAVPLIEQLESVPADARMMYEHDKFHHENIPVGRLCHEAASALRQAIAEAEKTIDVDSSRFPKDQLDHKPGMVITAPVQVIPEAEQPDLARVGEVGIWGDKREWVGLTDGEMVDLLKECEGRLWSAGFRAIEAKLKEKNT